MTRWTYHLCLPILVLVLGCGEGSPVAPPGTLLTINASPSRISLNGDSVITVTGRRPDGNRLAEGTEVRLSTTLGTIAPVIAEVDRNGIATAILSGDGRPGTATVSAATGAGGEGATAATIDVLIGESPETSPTVRMTVNPNNIPVGDATSVVTVIARNPDGTPVAAGQTVVLESTLGSLNPRRPRTDSEGTATSILTSGNQAGTAEVTATVGTSEVATASVTIRDAATDISVQANPASVARAGGTVTLTAFVTNSQGQGFQGAPVTFESERGSLQNTGVVFTNTSGVATNTLTLTQEQLEGVPPNGTFIVTATTPLGTGDLISDSTVVRVE